MGKEIELDDSKFCVTIKHPFPIPRKFKPFRKEVIYGKTFLDENTLIDDCPGTNPSSKRTFTTRLGLAFLVKKRVILAILSEH